MKKYFIAAMITLGLVVAPLSLAWLFFIYPIWFGSIIGFLVFVFCVQVIKEDL